MRSVRKTFPALAFAFLSLVSLVVAGCGDDDDDDAPNPDASVDAGGGNPDSGGFTVLDPFLPPIPPPAGGARVTFAEEITAANRATATIAGLASRGGVGDISLRNDKIRLVIQKPGRVFGAIPSGGNIIDADLVRTSGTDNDQFGELTTWFNLALYPRFDECRVLQDGAGGGAAAVRCFGGTDILEFINVPGMLWEFSSSLQTPLTTIFNNSRTDFVTAATYILAPGANHVEVHWTLYNPADAAYKSHIGSYIDTGAIIEPFSPFWGFGPVGISDTLKLVGGPEPVEAWGFQSAGVAYGFAPVEVKDADVGMTTPMPKMPIIKNAVFTISGLSVSAFTQANGVTGLANKPMTIGARSGANVKSYFAISTDVGGALGILAKAKGKTTGHVSGIVRDTANAPVVGARVAFTASIMRTIDGTPTAVDAATSVFTTDVNGRYEGDLQVGCYAGVPDATCTNGVVLGTYKAQADLPGFPRSAAATVTVTAGGTHTQDLTVGAPGRISVAVMEDTGAGSIATPCKVSVVGNNTNETDPRFRDTRFDVKPPGIVHVEAMVACAKTFSLRPGAYRVVVSRGNEFSVVDSQVTVTAGTTQNVTGTIRRVVDTRGWVAADFHQHGIHSHDSPMPSEYKVISYASEGVDYFVSSEHDFVYDYTTDIANAGLTGKLGFATGLESSPIDYGHWNFINYRQDNTLNGGAVDWGSPDPLRKMTHDEILTAAADRGVKVRISAHPRADAANTLFNYHDRVGLSYNLVGKTFGGNVAKMPVEPRLLHLPAIDLFSKKFEAMELLNGHKFICLQSSPTAACTSRLFDYVVDDVLKDYMNFLTFGFLVTGVGDSDSHKLIDEQQGFPRTYVFVGAGKDDPASATLTADVEKGMVPDPAMMRVAGATLSTNGPFVTVEVTGSGGTGGLGQLVTDSDGDVSVRVRVQSPSWIEYDRVEIFTNLTFRDDQFIPAADRWNPARSQPPLAAPIVLCTAAAAGCSGTFTVNTSNGLRSADLTHMLTGNGTKDAWVIVRVTGNRPLYPVIPRSAAFSAGIMPEDPAGPTMGVPALAVTSAVFVNADGVAGYQGALAP